MMMLYKVNKSGKIYESSDEDDELFENYLDP